MIINLNNFITKNLATFDFLIYNIYHKMLKIIKHSFRFAVSKEITIRNIFNGNAIATYHSFDDARVDQLLD